MRRIVTKRRIFAAIAVVLVVGVGYAVWLRDDGGGAAVATVAATRGDVVVTAGGVGRVVDAVAAGSVAAPAANAGGRAGSSATGASGGGNPAPVGAVFPQTGGVVEQVLVGPGQHLVAGQPLVVLADGGSTRINVELAANEVRVVQLEAGLQRSTGAGPTDIALAQLKVDTANKRLALAQLAADRMTVRTPRAGTVTAVLTAIGAPADSSTPIMTIADLDTLAVNLDVSEFDAAKVRVGQKATISVDALGGASYAGSVEVEALAGVDSGGVVTFPVRIKMAPGRPGVRPGMSASVRIVVEERRNVIVVPLEAVSQRGNGATVSMVGGQGRVTTRTVTLGVADNKLVEVKDGLRPGQRVQLAGAKGA